MEHIAQAGIVHVRIIAPCEDADSVVAELGRLPSIFNLVRVPDSSIKPEGDLVLCDVAREDVSVVVDRLRRLGIDRVGSIAVDSVDTVIATSANQAADAAAGSAADAVVWEEVEARTSESAELSATFVIFMVLATLIAAVGILTDSQILIIGAMVVGPEFGPLAGLCVALIQRRRALVLRSTLALAVGFSVAIAATVGVVLLLRASGAAPDEIAAQARPATFFIAHPDVFSVLIAVLAGIAGMLSLTTAKSGALIGVLISVTTIPAAGNVGVAIAYADWPEVGGALAQLGINLVCLVIAGTATLAVQRQGFRRRVRRIGP